MPSDDLLLADLCAEPALAAEVLVPMEGARRVRGSALVDIRAPSAWLQPSYLAATTGALLGDEADATAFVREVSDAQAAAIVFLRGVVRDAPPTGLSAACTVEGMPLLALPESVPYSVLARLVEDALHDAEGYRMRRRLWFQNDLLATLADERPLHAMIARMAHLVRGAAVLYDAAGRIVASVGEAPLRLLWSELEGRDRSRRSVVLGRYEVIATPVVMRGAGYWLCVASRHSQTILDVGNPLLDTAAQMLSAMRGARNLTRAQDLARARGLVAQLAGDVDTERIRPLWHQLRTHGFRPQTPLRAVVARPLQPLPPRDRTERLEHLYEEAHIDALPVVLSEETRGRTVVLMAIVADLEPLRRWLDEVAVGHAVGVSEPTTDLVRMAAACHDATTVMELLGERSDVGWFENVDLATWLIAGRPPKDMAARARATFGAFFADAELVRTTVTHLGSGCDVARTAERLFLHPNTVRYRLRKVERLVGGELADPLTMTNLCLALHRELSLGHA